MLWQLANAVALRPEVFGGIAFHRERGVTLELDEEAYIFLSTFLAPRSLPPAGHPTASLVPQLVRMGFLQLCAETFQREVSTQQASWLGDGHTLSAPETVHLAITTRCNLSCPGCYVPRCADESELSVVEWGDLIAQWAKMRVFQIAVGGGEPLLYDGLFEVLALGRAQGLVTNLTTNGTLLDADAVRQLQQAGVARVSVSWNSPGGNNAERSLAASRALQLLLDSRMQVGVNLLVTPTLLPRLHEVLAELRELGVQFVTVLRPKPPAISDGSNADWYENNRLNRDDLLRLHAVMNTWQDALALEVDSALVGLMCDAGVVRLRWRGVHGCTAGRRICTVWPDGRVTPCSFLGDLDAGNVRHVPFTALWKQGRNWDLLRDPDARPQGRCIGCAIAPQCGGARCIARYENGTTPIHRGLLAGDTECPYSKEGT